MAWHGAARQAEALDEADDRFLDAKRAWAAELADVNARLQAFQQSLQTSRYEARGANTRRAVRCTVTGYYTPVVPCHLHHVGRGTLGVARHCVHAWCTTYAIGHVALESVPAAAAKPPEASATNKQANKQTNKK